MHYIEQFTACRVLPDFEKGVADDDSPRRELAQQLCHGLGSLTVSRDNYGPFQVLPKFAGDDAPLIERARRSRSDLNERPVSNQRKRDFAVRQWAVNNEMVVAMYQNPYHVKVTLPYADREPGDGLSLIAQQRVSSVGCGCVGWNYVAFDRALSKVPRIFAQVYGAAIRRNQIQTTVR